MKIAFKKGPSKDEKSIFMYKKSRECKKYAIRALKKSAKVWNSREKRALFTFQHPVQPGPKKFCSALLKLRNCSTLNVILDLFIRAENFRIFGHFAWNNSPFYIFVVFLVYVNFKDPALKKIQISKTPP